MAIGPAWCADTATVPTQDLSPRVSAIADDYVATMLDFDPSPAYSAALMLKRHDYLPHNSAADVRAFEASEDALWQRLSELDPARIARPADRLLYAQMRDMLESGRGVRVCKQEGWNLNHMSGWQLGFTDLAAQQPVSTAEERAQALTRWRGMPRYIDNEIDNLRAGLQAGYSVPKPVANRVLRQIDALLVEDPEQSPFFAPAQRSQDEAFRAAFKAVLTERIQPSLRRYRRFLADEYLPQARDSLGLSALPDGAACYRAMLRFYTTIDRSPEEVYALGQRTVADNGRHVRELGRKLFDSDDLPTIIKRLDEAADNRFASADEALAFSRNLLERARERSAPYFLSMPKQRAVVEPLKPEQRGTGVSSRYENEPDPNKPGVYRANLDHVEDDRRDKAEITLVHETWPGHHMQYASSRTSETHPFLSLAFNSAYAEGWARYAERLGEEAGIYTTPYAGITRRLWPAHGMVVDPGLHLYGWTRKQAIDYLIATGRFSARTAEDAVDRYAAVPGQATSYDSGALEILALRREAEKTLGKRFDIRQFHAQVLADGVVPLMYLRERVNAWIAQSAKKSEEADPQP